MRLEGYLSLSSGCSEARAPGVTAAPRSPAATAAAGPNISNLCRACACREPPVPPPRPRGKARGLGARTPRRARPGWMKELTGSGLGLQGLGAEAGTWRASSCRPLACSVASCSQTFLTSPFFPNPPKHL